MKLSKNKKCATITLADRNPFRGTPIAFERKYTVCRITEGSTISIHPSFFVQVDTDLGAEDNIFAQKINSLNEKDRYYCGILELFFVKKKHLPKLKKWAKEHHDAVVVHKVDDTVEVIKQHTYEKES